MLCYKDRIFCTEKSCMHFEDCFRSLTDKVRKAAKIWWGSFNEDAPIAIFGSQPDCFEEKE